MIFTNDKLHGGKFKTEFFKQLKQANNLTVATGYFGTKLIEELEPSLLSIARKGDCKILLGMIFHGGVSAKQRTCLQRIDNKLRQTNPKNGIYVSLKDYHGKVYLIDEVTYIGSSNFSTEGFDSRWEYRENRG